MHYIVSPQGRHAEAQPQRWGREERIGFSLSELWCFRARGYAVDPAHARRWDLFEDLGGRFGSNGLGLLP